MKLVYFSHSRIPSREANSLHVIFMASAFAEMGFDVTLVSWPVGNRSELSPDELSEQYGVAGKIIHKHYKQLKIPGVSYVAAIAAAVNARLNGTDIVIGRNLRPCFFAALLRQKVIYETHQPLKDMPWLDRVFFHVLAKSKFCIGVVTISKPLAEILNREHNFDSTPLIVAGDAANPVKTGQPLTLNGPFRLHIGYIGSLYEGRGIDMILDMARALPDFCFNIVGGHEHDIKYWSEHHNTPKNIVFHGFLSAPSAEKIRCACDILIAPYQQNTKVPGGTNTARWMSPMKLFEYMAAGKPIICSDFPVLHEILEHEKTALFVKPSDHKAWISAITYLYCNPQVAKHLAKNALIQHRKMGTWTARCRIILDKCGVESSEINS